MKSEKDLELVLVFDGDDAGRAATLRSYRSGMDFGMNIKVVCLPEGQDPDSLICEDPVKWKQVLKDSQCITDYCSKVIGKSVDVPPGKDVPITDSADIVVDKQVRVLEVEKVKQALAEFELEVDEKWSKDRRVEFLEEEAYKAKKILGEREQEVVERADVMRYIVETCRTGPIEGDVRAKFYLKELIDAWFAFMFTKQSLTTKKELVRMIYRHRLQRRSKAHSRYKQVYIRYGIARGSITFDDGEFDQAMIARVRQVSVTKFLIDCQHINGGSGRIKVLCPFHQEKTPSFVVYPDGGGWYCFGACAKGGDVIDFVMELNNCNFIEALKILKEYI